MSKCWNCGAEITLRDEDVRCDNCGVIARFWCYSCKKPFDVLDKVHLMKLKECKWCTWYECPHCQAHAPDCEGINVHPQIVQKFIDDSSLTPEEKSKRIVDYFERVKQEKKIRVCERGNIPKGYAKGDGRIKKLLAKMSGFKTKRSKNKDAEAFQKRLERIEKYPAGTVLTIKKVRKAGYNGQEERDSLYLGSCMGLVNYQKQRFVPKGKKTAVEFDGWPVQEHPMPCPFFDPENILQKECTKCGLRFKLDETCPNHCVYKKNSKKNKTGENYATKVVISNKDVCRCQRPLFKQRTYVDREKEELKEGGTIDEEV